MTSEEHAAGGRPKRACDNCARLKAKCDSQSPCYRCASRGIPCSYRGRLCQGNDTLLQQATPDEHSTSSSSSSPKVADIFQASAQPPSPVDIPEGRDTVNSPAEQATRSRHDNQFDMQQTEVTEEEYLNNILMWDFDTFSLPIFPPFLPEESLDGLPERCKPYYTHFGLCPLITSVTSRPARQIAV